MRLSNIALAITAIYGAFSPADLFANGEQGVWYAPTDVNINWRRNLLTYTEEFDNPAWIKSAATISANSTTAPDGALTADTLTDDATNNFHGTYQNSSVSGAFTASIYVKYVNKQFVSFLTNNDNVTDRYAYFDLVNKTVHNVSSGFTASIVDAGNGWLRLSVSGQSLATGLRYYWWNIALSSNTTLYLGNGTGSVYIWGAQLEQSSTATAYQQIITPEITYLQTIQPQPVLFTDSAGTTPVTGVEQFVGLMLDKSQGLVLGPELVTNGDFSNGTTGWTLGTGWAIASGQATFTATGASSVLQTNATSPAVSGRTYEVRYTVVSNTLNASNLRLGGFSGNSYLSAAQTLPMTVGTQVFRFQAAPIGTGAVVDFWVTSAATSGSIVIDNISVRELPGNHAFQTSSAKRPKLAARYNLLTYSEEFDNGAWTKPAGSVSASQNAIGPNGVANSAATLTALSGSNNHWTYQSFSASAITYVNSVYAKAGTASWLGLGFGAGANTDGVYFNLSNGTVGASAFGSTGIIQSVGDGWYKCTVTRTLVGGTSFSAVEVHTANSQALNWSAAGTETILVWGADLRPASQATGAIGPTYQRVAAATVYDTAGFLPYLAFDGLDDSMSTNSIDFSAGATNAPLGSELVTNGDFSGGSTDWTLGTGWSVAAGQASHVAGTASLLTQNVSLTLGKIYKATCDLVSISGGTGSLQFRSGGTTTAVTLDSTRVGQTVELYYLAEGNTQIAISTGASTSITIDNISVKELLDPALAPDKMTVWAGVRKLSDALFSPFVELSSAAGINNGAFSMSAPESSGAASYGFFSRGTLPAGATASSNAAPRSNVLTGIGDISGDSAILRVNGTQAASNTADQGTGNYGNYPLYIGARNNASNFFNGWLTSLIVRGAQSTQSQIEATEAWVNGKTGAY